MFLFVAMAGVALASCTTDESVFDAADKGREIEFTAANYAVQTRAAYTNGNFSVWAWQNGKDVAHMENVSVSKDCVVSGGPYYWPNYALDFAATSPYGEKSIELVRRGGSSTITFTFDNSDADKKDDNVTNLMFADFVESQYYDSDADISNGGGQSITGTTYGKTVAIMFRHVLAKLNVAVNQVDPTPIADGIDSYVVKVNSLSLDGILCEGSLEVVEGTYDPAGYNIWTPKAGSATKTWNVLTSSTALPYVTNYGHADHNYLVMPQAIPDAAKLNINFTVTTTFDNETTSEETYAKSVQLNTIKNGGNTITNWYANKNITYTINITPADLTPISFTVQEEEMVAEGGSQNF